MATNVPYYTDKDPNSINLYAGLSGATLPVDEYELGHGVTLSKTYAHFMAPFLMAFSPAQQGKPHPTPWKAANGGFGFDIHCQLFVPKEFKQPYWFDHVNTIWWITALLRLKASTQIFVPVIANENFASIPLLSEEPYFWPVEVSPRTIILDPEKAKEHIELESLEWVRKYWLPGAMLLHNFDDFNIAMQAFDQCKWAYSPSLALVSLWGSLEKLFSSPNAELRFRISATIASFLEPPGEKRFSLYKNIRSLYDARSKAAHGARLGNSVPLIQTYALMRRILIKIIQENSVPSGEQLEAAIFGNENLGSDL